MKTLILLVTLLLAVQSVPYGHADGAPEVSASDKKKYRPAVSAIAKQLGPLLAELDKSDASNGPKVLEEMIGSMDKISVLDCPKDIRDAYFELKKASLVMSQAMKSGDRSKVELAAQAFSHARDEYALASSAYLRLD